MRGTCTSEGSRQVEEKTPADPHRGVCFDGRVVRCILKILEWGSVTDEREDISVPRQR